LQAVFNHNPKSQKNHQGTAMSERIKEVDNLHIIGHEELASPAALKSEFALEGKALETVQGGHRSVKAILDHTDPRLIVVVGPCSIHSPEEALEYARRLKALADEHAVCRDALRRCLDPPDRSRGFRLPRT